MNNIFRNVINAAANSTSTFVEKMYKSEKENFAKEIDGYSFETTITILDKEGNPVMVARSTVSDKPEVSKDFEEQVMKKINELAKNQSEVSKNSQPKTLVQESLETEVEKEVQSVPEAKVSQVRMPEIEKVEEPLVKSEAVNKELPKVKESKSEVEKVAEPPVLAEVEPVTAVPVGSMLNSNLCVKPVEEASAPAKAEVKAESEDAPNTSSLKAQTTGNETKRQKIEELLKRYSSLD